MVSDIIKEFRETHSFSMDALAGELTEELSERKLPPQFITKQAISLMERGEMKPNALMWEWLAENAKSDLIRILSRRVLKELCQFHGEGVA